MANNSSVVSISAPPAVVAGQVFNASVTFQNTGDVVWRKSTTHRLGSANPQDNSLFGTHRWEMPTDLIVSGGTITFDLQLTAPVAGNYVMAFQMVQDGVAWFGAVASTAISVNNAPPPPPPQFPLLGAGLVHGLKLFDTGIVPVQAVGVTDSTLAWVNTSGSAVKLAKGSLRLTVKSNSYWDVSADVFRTSDGALVGSAFQAYNGNAHASKDDAVFSFEPNTVVIAPGDGLTFKHSCKPNYPNATATVRHSFSAWAVG